MHDPRDAGATGDRNERCHGKKISFAELKVIVYSKHHDVGTNVCLRTVHS